MFAPYVKCPISSSTSMSDLYALSCFTTIRAVIDSGSLESNQRGDSSRNGEMNSCNAQMQGVTAKRIRQPDGVAKGKAKTSLTSMPITMANWVKVPRVPLRVGGAISPR